MLNFISALCLGWYSGIMFATYKLNILSWNIALGMWIICAWLLIYMVAKFEMSYKDYTEEEKKCQG